ncbi:MAG: aminomethyltransferase family protein [Actinomycetota bacterium]
MSVGTAFYPRQLERNTKQAWGEWAGYFAPAVYADFHDIEYSAIREAAAVIDTSPLYKYVVRGPDAGRLLDRVMTRDVSKMQIDQVYYTPWCNEAGKMIDDGTLTRLAETEYRITAADPCYRWFFLSATGLDVEIDDVSAQLAGLALQGKLSREVLEAATRQDWADVRYFRHRRTEIGGVEISVTRTGYTGDRGYELWIPADGALEVWDAVFEAGEPYGLFPAGIHALDIARVEAGLILIEAEYTSARHAISPEQTYSPFEIGLGKLVDFGKTADFNGRRALQAEQQAGGPQRRLVGLELDWAGIEGMFAKHGLASMISQFVDRSPVPVYRNNKQIGRATSIAWGTTIKKMVGFGSLDKSLEKVGSRVSVEYSVEGERGKVAAAVVPLPFLDLPRKRT